MCIEQVTQATQQFNLSPEAEQAIKDFEGCSLTAYDDLGGTLSIGYGHTRRVRPSDRITQWYADQLFALDIAEAERAVNALHLCKTQGQFDALVDFVFNLGQQKLANSTLLRYIRESRSEEEIVQQFMRWCYAGGQKIPGLERRCQWRAQRWAS